MRSTSSRLIIRCAYIAVAAVIIGFVLYNIQIATAIRAEAVAHLNPIDNESLAVKAVIERLTGSLYQGASEERAQMLRKLSVAETYTGRAQLFALGFVLLSVMYLVAIRTSVRGQSSERMQVDFLVLATLCLIPGLLAPMLTISSGVKIPVLGDVVIQHEAKSIIGVVQRLFGAGNWFPALLVSAFSIGIPLVKLTTLAWEDLPQIPGPPRVLSNFAHYAGRWSMADVFVVAIVVAFLAGTSTGPAQTALGLGLYFFTAYAFISQWAAHLGSAIVSHSAPTSGST